MSEQYQGIADRTLTSLRAFAPKAATPEAPAANATEAEAAPKR